MYVILDLDFIIVKYVPYDKIKKSSIYAVPKALSIFRKCMEYID